MTDTKLKLDLGCGRNKKQDFLGIDRRSFPEVDAVTDLTQKYWIFETPKLGDVELIPAATSDGYMLPANSVQEAHCSHFLEHLDHNQHNPERVRFMNELYRVLIPGGKATIITPHWNSNRAFGDYTHADKPVSEMFYYYLSKEWRKTNAPDNDIEWNPDGYSCNFGATWGYSLRADISARNQEFQTFAMQNFKEACEDLFATLTANK